MSRATFNVTVEESHAVLKKVLPLMSQQQVPTIPQNYAVWYDYVCESNRDLVAELRDRMERGLKFSPDACQRLYEKYFLDEVRTQVEVIQKAMRRALGSLQSELSGLDDELGSFVTVLDDSVRSLAQQPGPEEIVALVAGLVHAAHTARNRSAATGTALKDMADELSALRAQVDALTRDTLVDTLTGVASRRAFDDALARMTREVNDGGEPLCLLMADIDQFQAVSEAHGREVSEQVLRFVAQEMDQCVKGRDLLARYDGTRFAILLPATSYNGALMLAESLRAIIEAQVVETDGGLCIQDLTISVGVAQFRAGEGAGQFVARAGACLRQSKAQWRNRVTGERDLRAASEPGPSQPDL